MFSIIPRDKGFFDLFEKAGEVVLQTAEAFASTMKDYARREEYIAKIRQCEHEGDDIAHRTLDKLDKTFVTPFDREDIHSLIVLMDDVIDEVDAASKRFILYQIPEPTPYLVKQAEVLVEACKSVVAAVKQLRHLKKPRGLHGMLVEIHRLENVGDDNHHAAVAELFNTSKDAIQILKLKEIYERTEKAIDRCEDIANTIEAIVLKNG